MLSVTHIRGGSISPLPISIQFRHFGPEISAISISVTAALFGLFIYMYSIVVSVVPQLPFRTSRDVTRCNDVSQYQIISYI